MLYCGCRRFYFLNIVIIIILILAGDTTSAGEAGGPSAAAAPPLYTCSDYEDAQRIPLPENSGITSYQNITLIVADIVCPSLEYNNDNPGMNTGLFSGNNGNSNDRPTTITNSDNNNNDQTVDWTTDYQFQHVPTKIHIYVIENDKKKSQSTTTTTTTNETSSSMNNTMVQHKKNEIRYNSYPPNYLQPEIRNVRDVSIQGFVSKKKQWGLFFVYHGYITFEHNEGATLELWVPIHLIEDLLIIGPHADHFLEVTYIVNNNNNNNNENNNKNENTQQAGNEETHNEEDDDIDTPSYQLEDFIEENNLLYDLDDYEYKLPPKPRISVYTNGIGTSTTVRVIVAPNKNTVNDHNNNDNGNNNMSVLIIDTSYNSTLQLQIDSDDTSTSTAQHTIVSKGTNLKTTIMSHSPNMTGSFRGRNVDVYINGYISNIALMGSFMDVYAAHDDGTNHKNDSNHSSSDNTICSNVTIASVVSSSCHIITVDVAVDVDVDV
eukprot:CAMPEP_0170934106 /NCGR_PEP_ID=MMETSP0735-20130129/18094_1 /TAXON_ID=186038 /ORGANISM="Fragilariopsis kerguelensis, Strain L26-C5" /LENGTH=490 /DNA_ID=CAMNT_0011337139 /DNA_START=1 /DNA_END=1469 /DNA_ORIENTATION=-